MSIHTPHFEYFSFQRLFIALSIHGLAGYFLYNNLYLNESYWQIPLVFALVILQVFTVSSFMHKMLTHKVWKFNFKFIDHIFANIALASGHVFPGCPITWSVVHRLHHNDLDGEYDAHSPTKIGYLLSHFHLFNPPKFEEVDRKYYFDLMKNYHHLLFYGKYPRAIAFSLWLGIFLIFGLEGLAIWGMASLFESHGLGIIDAYSHAEGNGQTRNIPWWLVAIGLNDPEGSYHKEHHAHPDVYSFNPTWIDYPSRIMELLSKIGLVEIRGRKFKNRNELFEGKV